MTKTERPIYKTETCHAGDHLCSHNHRTISSADRCLPKLPKGASNAFSLARVVPQNDAAREELAREVASYG